jgi:hypothetical protein
MSSFLKAFRRLDRDESGMETMQAVIIFGVAAVVLAALYNMKDKIFEWVQNQLAKFM